MTVVESTPRCLVLKSGASTLALEKDTNKATLHRKLLLWKLKPVERSFSEFVEVTIDTAVDRASGVETCSIAHVTRAGAAWSFPATDKAEASATASRVREFLGLPG